MHLFIYYKIKKIAENIDANRDRQSQRLAAPAPLLQLNNTFHRIRFSGCLYAFVSWWQAAVSIE